jgi:hypothetical protein
MVRTALYEAANVLLRASRGSQNSSAEAWQRRFGTQSHTQYALGAMEEVGSEYTRISIETAERVGKQLKSGLASVGIVTDFRLQGSVPLNVHIRGVSDVDLLCLDGDFYTYANAGALSQTGFYRNPTQKNSIGVLSTLRSNAEKVLTRSYPAAKVDTSGGKAINITGGSLARPVDVVPSHWYDTIAYQNSGLEYDRGVTILNKKTLATIDNFPFLHIKRIEDKCNKTLGGLRKAIRLCKNVKADAVEEGTLIDFPSFDIAATIYHADNTELILGNSYELRILAETQRFLDYLYHNPTYAMSLKVPDDSRAIFDTQRKYEGMKRLSMEMDELLRKVTLEQAPQFGSNYLFEMRDHVGSLMMPR